MRSEAYTWMDNEVYNNKVSIEYKHAQLKKILRMQLIKPVFQPIVSLTDGSLLGYETLSRITDKECTINIEELFQLATQKGELWELEKLCRYKSLEKFGSYKSKCKLFINVDGNTIHAPDLKSGYTLNLLKQFTIDSANIVFEITEQNSINAEYLDTFAQTIEHYRNQNFMNAIDDYGCGYSGLNRVCALNPDYLKIDMKLIRDIDSDSIKKSAVSSTIQFCKDNAITVIAEGIETEAELNTLIQLGADYGQGYYLGRPQKELYPISSLLVAKIKACRKRFANNSIFGKIHTIGTRKETVTTDIPALQVYEKMKKEPLIDELFVVDSTDNVIGILTRPHIMECFSGQYGFNLSQRMSVKGIMEDYFLAVDAHCSIESVAETAMGRNLNHIYDAIAVTKKGRYISTVTVKELLLKTIQIQTKHASDANPLTGLPGNSRIQEIIRQIFIKPSPWSLVYFDLDNFKAYNDAYGFGKGDLMIETLADILKRKEQEGDFCGHVGGDDFVLIAERYSLELQCEEICKEFSVAIQSLYTKEDWEQGYIISQNRSGDIERFPIASLSIAIVTNEHHQPQTLDELFHIIAKTKKKCKSSIGHSIISV